MNLRDQPRKRHHVARPVVILLSPFFRFSHHRAAYVLRTRLGETHGPVLVAPAGRERRRERLPD